MSVRIDWGMVYFFGPAKAQFQIMPVDDRAHANWVIDWALANGAESAELIDG